MNCEYVVSIDCSISSTGISVFEIKTGKTFLYCYSDKIRKKDDPISFKKNNIEVLVERQPKKDTFPDTFSRYINATEHIFEIINKRINDNVFVFIEGYSFASKGMLFSIGEFCSLLKYQFYKTGVTICEVSPSEWKKEILGNGSSKKDEIYNFHYENDLSEILKEFEKMNYIYKKGSFLEDLCDCYSIQKYTLKKFNKT